MERQHATGARARADSLEERLGPRRRIEGTRARVHQVPQRGLAGPIVLLHELVRGGSAAEARREHLVEHSSQPAWAKNRRYGLA